MLFFDLIEETKFALSANKSRSVLTILGIVIGIASVITMISIGQGASKDISSNIESLGSNLLVVTPGAARNFGSMAKSGAGSASTLKLSDAEAISSSISGIVAVSPTVSSRQQVKTTLGKNTNTSVYGVEESYFGVKNIAMASGIFINSSQNLNLAKVAVLGPTVRDDLFGQDADPVGQKIKINNLEFNIIGLTQSKGGTGFGNADDIVYVPLATAQRYFTGGQSVSNINIQVAEAKQMSFIQQQASNLLLELHHISDPLSPDFSIVNQADVLGAVTAVTDTMTLLLAAIAGISLLVGGIGIMNMMLTTVTERTREIGLRKSLGATNKDISNQFLAEAVALTFLGGIIGFLLGWIASLLVYKFVGMTTVISLQSVLLAFGVSALIGIIFGYYPAKRASSLNPIEALRYE